MTYTWIVAVAAVLLAGVGLTVQTPKYAEPPKVQLDDAKKAFAKLGADFEKEEWDTHTLYVFSFPVDTNDEALKLLPMVPFSFGLSFEGTRVTNQGLTLVTKMKHLTFLNLTGTQVSDTGLKQLLTAKDLQYLSLRATGLTDAGLKEVAKLNTLVWLRLGSTAVTDAGLRSLLG
jgi:hypothetical protein